MKNKLKYVAAALMLVFIGGSCTKENYSLGDLSAPSGLAITTEIVGQDANHPDGDGSGDVKITLDAKNALAYKIDYDAADGISFDNVNTPTITKKYTKVGINNYRITVVAYGKGGSSSTITKDISVRSDFTPDPAIVEKLTGGSSKTWGVDKSLQGHFGVGPWSATSVTPSWWSASVNEKVACCNCFYTASFKFNKTGSGFTIDVTTPDGAFTKTGSLAGGLPGIPSSGDEGCYSYSGGSSSFSFVPAGSGVAASTPSTQTAILLSGSNTFIGYGALQKEYEILEITDTFMYLRVQGTETGNAWYIKMKAL